MKPRQFQRHHILIGLLCRQRHVDRLFTVLDRSHQVGQIHIWIRSRDQIHMMFLDQVLLYTFGHTAQDANDQWFLFLSQRMEVLQTAQDLLLRVVTDRTGIHEYSVCLIKMFRHLITGHIHDRGYHLTIRHIHLTTIRLNKYFFNICLTSRF